MRLVLVWIIYFFIGTALTLFLPEPDFKLSSIILFLISLSLLFFRKRKVYLIIFTILLGLSVGLFRTELAEFNFGPIKNEYVGYVSSDIETRDKNQRYVVTFDEFNALVTSNLFDHVSYGDEVLVKGDFKEAKSFETDSGRIFDYKNYLLSKNIQYTIFDPSVELTENSSGFFIKRGLFFVKNKFLEQIDNTFIEPVSSLLSGILLGVESSLGDDLEDVFRIVALIHIVVLSGYNISIVAEGIIRGLAFVPKKISFGIAIVAIILFVIMTGASSATVRAGIMASILLIGKIFDRTSEALITLLIAACLMVLHNPYILFYDVGFHLSFLATAGILIIVPRLIEFFSYIRNDLLIRDIILTTISAQFAILPYIVWRIGDVSVIGVVANILVIPLVPIIMLFGFLSTLISFFSSTLALPFTSTTHILLEYVINISEWLASFKFSFVVAPNYSLWFLIMIVSYLVFSYFFFKKLN